jgi:nicotinamide phosphoribosyltransferase
MNPVTQADFYKTGHIFQYPPKTQKVYSNFTARGDKHAKVSDLWDKKVVNFGLQGFIRSHLVGEWNRKFFNKPLEQVIKVYKRRMDTALGPGAVDVTHIEKLHKLGYLPIEIKALPEGSRVNLRVPLLTVVNTKEEFYWLTNYIETVLSAELWKPITNATIAYEFRRQLDKYVEMTGSSPQFANWQNHDFSMRGMSGIEDAAKSGAAHLLVNYGTDTIPAIDYLEDYYGANAENELIGGSVPATEHSVMCMGGVDGEIETFRRLVTQTYPGGIVSVVSDTWDFWKVITEYAKELREEILNRTPDALGMAKVVFRPDSGDPVDILTGDVNAELGSPANKGAVECLWEIFGGDVNEKGYKTLNQRVGLIYGDSITIDRQKQILERLAQKGFSAGNVVFGVGSYTYQYVTRDTFGLAVKATWGVVDGEARELFKDPITDSGTKKSAKGLLRVEKENGDYVLYDQQTLEQESQGELRTVFLNGMVVNPTTLAEIRSRLGLIKN